MTKTRRRVTELIRQEREERRRSLSIPPWRLMGGGFGDKLVDDLRNAGATLGNNKG